MSRQVVLGVRVKNSSIHGTLITGQGSGPNVHIRIAIPFTEGMVASRTPARSPNLEFHRHLCFNPLPASMPGETCRQPAHWGIPDVFQSAPGIDAGRNGEHIQSTLLMNVSIRSRHRCREKRSARRTLDASYDVSIRSRHRCREKRCSADRHRSIRCFNPLPASMPGETIVGGTATACSEVSIRSRHRCREKAECAC